MNKFTQNTPQVQPVQPPSYSEQSFLYSWVAAVGLPLVQATITGAFIAALVSFILVKLGANDVIGWTLFTWLLISSVAWIWLHRNWLNGARIEKWLNRDLNADGVIGEPPRRMTITVNRVKENEHVEQMQHAFPVSDQQIARFFTTVKTSTRGGKGISRRQWTPKNVNGFSESEWDEFYKELVHQQLVTIKGNECILSTDGEEIADGWYSRAQEDATPPPNEDE
jgi:hypothetical protein